VHGKLNFGMLFTSCLDLGFEIDKQKPSLKFNVPNDTDFDALTPELLINIISLLPRVKHQDQDVEFSANGASDQL
jgi:hypothetical protein